MNEWLLTDEEMLKVVSNIPTNIKPDKSVTIFLQAECQAIAKAQVKRMVEWLKAYPRHFDGEIICPHIPKDDWQALLKEVEDE